MVPPPDAPVIGLIPAAGQASRLGPLPCSKEILPLGFTADAQGRERPRILCQPLLESFHEAGVERAIVLLRRGKWDIPAFLGSGSEHGVELIYRVLEKTAHVPETLSRAVPFLGSARVALGFPDILFSPRNAFTHLLSHQRKTGAPVVLGLFPTTQTWKTDMVELDAAGRARRLVIKDRASTLRFTWSIAVWTSLFTDYLSAFLAHQPAPGNRELYVGDVIQAAIEDGLEIETVSFENGSFLDAGTPEDLRRTLREHLD